MVLISSVSPVKYSETNSVSMAYNRMTSLSEGWPSFFVGNIGGEGFSWSMIVSRVSETVRTSSGL